jgi:hypothetical protein
VYMDLGFVCFEGVAFQVISSLLGWLFARFRLWVVIFFFRVSNAACCLREAHKYCCTDHSCIYCQASIVAFAQRDHSMSQSLHYNTFVLELT